MNKSSLTQREVIIGGSIASNHNYDFAFSMFEIDSAVRVLNKINQQMTEPVEAFINHITRRVVLSEEEKSYLASIVRITKISKKQYLLMPGVVCRYKSYIFYGALRAYFVSPDGQEHTISLAIDDWWISDYNSYLFQQPATLFIEAIDESVLVQIEYHQEEKLIQMYPVFDRFLRLFTENALASFQKRIVSNLSKTAEERYKEYLQKYPALVSKVPQYAVASYLGISTQFLSKIRNSRRKEK